MSLSIVGNNQHYTAGEIKDWSVVYMGSSCKRTQFALLKDKSGVVHKYDFGDDTSNGCPFEFKVLAHTTFPAELELDKASAVHPHPNSENIYYAVKDKIWLLNTATNERILFHDFNVPSVNVVEIHVKNQYGKHYNKVRCQ